MTRTAAPSTVRLDAPVQTPSHAGVRLTRRGRVLVLLALLGLVLTAFILGRAVTSQAATSTPVSPLYPQTTAHQGESLWTVAERVAPGRDPRALVQQIRELNHLDSGAVRVGQQLLLPREHF